QPASPKTRNAMLLERSSKTNDALVLEEWSIPLDRFGDIRTTGVYDIAQMIQKPTGKRHGAFNVSVNASIFTSHSISSCFRAAFATSWLRYRQAGVYESASDCGCK